MEQLELTDEERALGYISWRLVGSWTRWVKRRVETINFETATSIRRKVSVDVRLQHDLFDEPVVRWGDDDFHYVPIAQLRKGRLVRFDLRDEDGSALPLITKKKNSAIAAAMLAAVAQSLVANEVASGDSSIEIVDVSAIEIPSALISDFRRLAYLELHTRDSIEGADAIIDRFKAASERPGCRPVSDWDWLLTEGRLRSTNASLDDWRAAVGADIGFASLAYDLARHYFIYAPLRHDPGQRRIVKFSYSEFLGDGQSSLGVGIKAGALRLGIGRAWNSTEDWLEGLPKRDPGVVEQWSPSLDAGETRTIPPRRRLFEGLGWTTRVGKYETPAVSHAASYHLDISTPSGIQIRRAQLVCAATDGATKRHAAQRGNRSLRAVDLYASGSSWRSGNAFLHMRPESSLIIRSAALSAMLIALLLTLLWALGHEVTAHRHKYAEAAALALVVIPGLLTVLSSRDDEHPLATSMAFGLRVLAIVPGLLAFTAAAEVLYYTPRSWFGIALSATSWLVTVVLFVAWRLAARGRPDPRALA